MITAVIAEKPSVAKDIANVLNVRERHDGYLSGNGYLVTWAFGHLVQLAMPEAYGYTGFRRENLPILPQEFKYIPRQIREGKEYKPDPGVLKQLKVIREVFDRSDRIVVATDAGREGEAIHRYIYNYLGCRKPCLRLWISSLTDRAIREGLDNLRPGSDYDNLYRAAEARAIADWEIGLNATQALSIAAGQGIYSLGRVQTPTLMMICSRYLENRDFTPQTYFRLKVTAEKDGTPFAAISELRYETLPAANAALAAVTATGTVQVADVQRREVSQEPPLLYDLTALQKEANGRYGFSADKTLSVAQSLYEKKVLSYPRTGSRYLSDDVFDEIPDRIALLKRYPAFAAHAAALKGASLNRRSVDAGKVTDHHALIITECLPGELSADERTVYDMVAARLLEAFSARCLKDVTTVSFTAGNSVFTAKGTVVRSAGWRAVRNERDEDDEGTAALPPLQPGEAFPLQSAECVEKQTKPRPPAHREQPPFGDGALRQGVARRRAAGQPERERHRHARHPCLHHRDPLCPGLRAPGEEEPRTDRQGACRVPDSEGQAHRRCRDDWAVGDRPRQDRERGDESRHLPQGHRGLCRPDYRRTPASAGIGGGRRTYPVSQVPFRSHPPLPEGRQVQQRRLWAYRLPQQGGEAAHRQPDYRPRDQRQNIPYQRLQEQGRQALRCVPHLRQGLPHRVRVPAPHGQAQRKGAQAMNGIGWITVAEAARLCGTDELRITLWMNGNHIAYARFDGILMIDGASLAALFSRNRVATIYEDVAQQRGKPGRPGRLRRLLDTPLDTFGLSQRIVRACRELGVFTVEHLLVHLRRFRFSRLYCVRNFGSGSAAETLRRLRQDGLTDGGSPRDFKVLYP